MNDNMVPVSNVGLSGLGDIKTMAAKLEENIKRRELVYNLIEQNFKEGIDYGPADQRNHKPTLLKPGAEKVCGWFNTHPEWEVDTDTWKMLGEPKSTVCYICKIIENSTGFTIGTGRGAETVGNKGRDINKAIKNAEKTSIVDAALWTFSLSERFTQQGNEKLKFNDGKKALMDRIIDLRAGCDSTLTDIQFLCKVCDREIHKKSITTSKELEMVSNAIEKYDFETGDKLPDDL